MAIYRNLIILFLLLSLYFACGQNPTEPPIKPDVRTIKGNVRLENQTDHYGIFVYLEELNQCAFTDENGDYTLTLADSLFSGDGLMKFGQFHMYYSFPFYDFDSILVKTNQAGFVFGEGALDQKGRIMLLLILKQVICIKTVTDKTSYTPMDSLLVRNTIINRSNRKLGMSPCLRSVDLFDNLMRWYYIDYTYPSETEYKLIPGDSIFYIFKYPLDSILESRWGIVLPWRCRVWSINYYISNGLKKVPNSIKGIISADGWLLLQGIHFLNLPINSWDRMMHNSFLLSEIIIINNQ